MTTQRIARRQRGQSAYSSESPGSSLIGGGHRIGFAEQTQNQTTSSATYENMPGMSFQIEVPPCPFKICYRVPIEIATSGDVANVGLFRDLPGIEQYQNLNFHLPRAAVAAHRHEVTHPGLWLPSGILGYDDIPVGSSQVFRLRWKRESGTGALNINLAFLTTQLETCQMWAETG